MAEIIKRPFKSFNGKDWDTHYFPTSADQVVEDDSHMFCTRQEKDDYYNAYVDGENIPFTFPTDENEMVAVNTSYIVKKNGFVYVHVEAKNGYNEDFPLPWWTDLGYLPEGYRPLYDSSFHATLRAPSHVDTVCTINAKTGLIQVLAGDLGQKVVCIDICFHVGGGTI